MVRLGGESASRGIAIGPTHLLELRLVVSERWILLGDRDAEVARLDRAVATADGQLDRLKVQIDGHHSGEGHDLIEAHRLMLRSPELAGEARRLVAEECLAAEWAVSRALVHIRSIFSQLDDAYFRERGGDFEVVGERLLRVLLGLTELRPGATAPAGGIAAGVDISPLDPFHLHRAGIAGMVSESGGPTSHAAIVARALGMPYVVGVAHLSQHVRPGATLIVDGTRGEVIVDPDPEVLRAYQSRAVALRQRAKRLESTRELPAITSDGVRIHLAGNVESVTGIAAALAAGAESIGLFRTEFLYLERADLPSEQEQYDDAVSALRNAGGLPITFRTLDLGGDKLPLAMKIATGSNPALGVRSVRFLLQHPEILRRQLRALYRAASVGPLRFMFPLVSGVGELTRLRAICDEVRAGLADDRIPHAPATALGVMIETPSAALTADHLAKRCDFLSVGTNDLMQYTFAADRENEAVAHLYQPLHPAVLRTLRALAAMAQTAGIPLSICGDMAGNPFLTWLLIGLGFRDLSMDAPSIPLVKTVVRGSSLVEAQALVAQALELETQVEVADLIESKFGRRFATETEGFRPHPASP
jgi:phosphoenolpyruvate-protein phosphotransferase (PTS system enzyme I)